MSASFVNQIYELVEVFNIANIQLHGFGCLFHLLESPICIHDCIPLSGVSHYVGYRMIYACSWPISSKKLIVLSPEVVVLGYQNDYVLYLSINILVSI